MYRCLASGWSEFETKTVACKNIKEKMCLVVSESNNFETKSSFLKRCWQKKCLVVSESNNFGTRKQLSEKMLTAKVPGGLFTSMVPSRLQAHSDGRGPLARQSEYSWLRGVPRVERLESCSNERPIEPVRLSSMSETTVQ
jgi:hypothetical protein